MSMEFSECGALAKALAAAQAEMANPSFDSANPHFKSKFASLAAVRNAVVPVLAKHGIAVLQDLQTTENGIACYTVLMHESGQTRTLGPLVMPASNADAQGFGSASTYARRYALQSVACVVGDDDDDGNAAVASTPSGWKADPRGDLGQKVDTKLVNKWAKALIDQQDQAHRLADIWGEVKEDHDLAVAVWAAIPKAIKDRIKDAQEGKSA
ncbi:MAG: hypothetical protein RL671_171 [Pseudomonadota bacterium]